MKRLIYTFGVFLVIAGFLFTAHVQATGANPFGNASTSVSAVPYTVSDNMGSTSTVVVNTSTGAVDLQRWSGTDQVQITPLGAYQMSEIPANAVGTSTAFNIDFSIPSLPASNIFQFAVSSSPDVAFYYQAPLWADAGLPGPTQTCTDTQCTIGSSTENRPQNIIGSYAVYSIAHQNDVIGQTNYASGKLFQIDRPIATDSSGATTTAIMNIVNGMLTITIPQSFLNQAIYPIIVDPTFGYTTIGGTTINNGSSNFEATAQGSAPAGTITSISVYGSETGSACPTENVMYDNSSPYNLKDYTAAYNTAAAQWTTGVSTQSFVMTSGATYNIGVINDATGCTGQFFAYYDTGGTHSTTQVVGYTNPPPATQVNTTDAPARLYSAYVTYTSSGGGSTVLHMIMKLITFGW